MDKFRIKGGKVLRGTVAISGAKNSALPVMAAALLTAEKVTLHNIPKVRDLITMSKLLAWVGASVGSAVGWWAGDRFGLFSAFLLSMVGTGAGLYLGRWMADALID